MKIDYDGLNKVDNAVIMAAGVSSRFAPISYEYPKALLKVRGEILIERQIKQLKEAQINDIIVVVGYKKELFYYLKDKYNVSIVENPDYMIRNNNSSLYHVRDRLSNTYICSADNYFIENLFESHVEKSYYSAVFNKGITDEWCISTDNSGLITDVVIGGKDAWVMLGHAFFTKDFSKKFVDILEKIYDDCNIKPMLWENIYLKYINELPMYIKKYTENKIFEFDTLDELREFDESYWDFTESRILKQICMELNCEERDIVEAKPIKSGIEAIGFSFKINMVEYKYLYNDKLVIKLEKEMNIEDFNLILDLCKDKLSVSNLEDVRIKRLGGLTNKNYKVDVETGSYVIRLPGEGTEELINRKDEHICTDLANQVNIDSKLLYFDDNTGIKISEYIVEAETMSAELLKKKENIKSIACLLKKLHTCGKAVPVIFNVFEKVEIYESLIKKYEHISLWNDYEEIKKQVYGLKDEFEEMNIQLTMCHCDPLCENFVKGNDRMYLVDWEYAGMNDPMWDLADVFIEAEYTPENEELFNSFYFDEIPSKELKRRIIMNKVFLDFLWSLWGIQRYCCGEDLLEYGNERYERAKKNLKLLLTKNKN